MMDMSEFDLKPIPRREPPDLNENHKRVLKFVTDKKQTAAEIASRVELSKANTYRYLRDLRLNQRIDSSQPGRNVDALFWLVEQEGE